MARAWAMTSSWANAEPVTSTKASNANTVTRDTAVTTVESGAVFLMMSLDPAFELDAGATQLVDRGGRYLFRQ
jgi:hypothetical protein